MLYYHLSILVVCLIHMKFTNGWNIPSSNQYHIQTDEGPERYFRYQTDNGQYRKEKRLEDGTVVGTYAWIDDNGVLRQRDYIADTAGYRILNTKNVYVGRNVPVGKAVKIAKKYSATISNLRNYSQKTTETILSKTKFSSGTYGPNTLKYTTSPPFMSTTAKPYEDVSSNNMLSTSEGVLTSAISPVVNIVPTSIYSTISRPLLLPTNNSIVNRYDTGTYGSTYNSIDYRKKPTRYYQMTPNHFVEHTSSPSIQTTYESLPTIYTDHNETPKTINRNDLNYNPYISHLQDVYTFQNGPTYPVDQEGNNYVEYKAENKHDPQYQTYNGVYITNDGFRYYIPKAYHEEQTVSANKRTGSFGYIDPFGIRRVIYYNTSPENGFQHKKNNRYVGFQATSYDPRP